METMRVEEIPIAEIILEGQQIRRADDDDHIVELSMSIAKHGLLEPIVVRANGYKGYQLEAGKHRIQAFLRLNKSTIPAHIREGVTQPIKSVALVENLIRRDLTIAEEIDAVIYLYDEEKLSASQICDLLGKSRAWVDVRLAIPDFPDDVKDELFDGNLSIKKSEEISRVEDYATRRIITNQVINAKLTQKQTEDLIKAYLETPSICSAIEAGIETAAQIQTAAPLLRECFTCKNPSRLERLSFLAVCFDCVDAIQKHTQENYITKGEVKND